MSAIGVVLVAALVVLFGISLWFFVNLIRHELKDEPETRTIEETVDVTERFEQTTATLTYPDGTEETITYDDSWQSRESMNMRTYITYDTDSFEVGRTSGLRGEDHPTIEKDISDENKRLINLDNVRDIDIERVEEFVAVAEVEVEKTQAESSYSALDWRTVECEWDSAKEHDIEIWRAGEWESYKDSQ